MIPVRFMYGSIGAAWGALLPLLALLLVIPPLICTAQCGSSSGSRTDFATAGPGDRWVTVSVDWAPYVDNAEDGMVADREGGKCRPARSPMPPQLRLTRYEFPKTFDPADFRSRPLYACILAKGDGAILAVQLAQKIQDPVADRELVATIRRGWRFEGYGSNEVGWERVRLNPGLPIDPPLVF